MKIPIKEALDEMEHLTSIAVQRMVEGTDKYGEEMVPDPLQEFEEECADAINYIVMGYIKFKKGYERAKLRLVKRQNSTNNGGDKGDWESY